MKRLILMSALFITVSAEPICSDNNSTISCVTFDLKSDETLEFNSTIDTLAFYEAGGSIGRKTFSSKPGIRRLQLVKSNIKNIEAGALCSIPNLKWLEIHADRVFPVLTDSLLDNCQNLELLRVQNVELLPTTFKHVTNVETLSMLNLKVFHLTREYFESIENLKDLRLYDSKIENIDPGAICSSRKLERIILKHNELPPISKSMFENCDLVQDLTIAFYNHTDIEEGTFNYMTNLRRLDASYLNMKHLTKDHLRGLTHLDTLSLMSVNMEMIECNAFVDLMNLRKLTLIDNSLKKINSIIFESTPNLRELNLGSHQLTTIDNIKHPQLTKLRVGGHSICTVDTNLLKANLPELNTFTLQNNQMNCSYKSQLFQDLMKMGIHVGLVKRHRAMDGCHHNLS